MYKIDDGVNPKFTSKRIKKGEKVLDKFFPKWRDKILGEINFLQSGRDILSLLFGDFHVGLKKLGLAYDKATLFGFHVPLDQPSHYIQDYLKNLSRKWNKAIATQ